MPPSRPQHRADLESLRGLAVLLVVAYHAGVPALGGAFVAVDVFFLLSGWFTGRALVQEYATTGTLDLWRFYRRRTLRLLPPLLAVVAATLALVWALWAPIDRPGAVAAAPAVLTGTSNIAFARTGVNYFAGPRSPFVHTWSLGVELQLSLLGPLLLLGLATLGGGRSAATHGAERARRVSALVRGVGGGLAAVGVLSLGYATWLATVDPAGAYFSTLARLWVFAAGVLLALALPSVAHDTGAAREGRGRGWWLQAGGLAAIAVAVLFYDRTIPYPGTAALLPVLGAAAFVAGGLDGRGVFAAQGRLARAAGWLGKLSYAWYLWHWPIVLTAAVIMPTIGPWMRLAWSALALVPAWLTWRAIERPLRAAADTPARARWLPVAAVAGCLALALVSSGMHGAAEEQVARAGQRVFAAARDDRMPHACWAGSAKQAERAPADCVFGDPEGTATVALFGDSHAEHWLAALDRLGRERGWRVVLFVMGGCPVADSPELVKGSTDRRGRECARYREASLRRIVALHPDVAVLSSFDEYVTRVPEPVAGRSADGRVSVGAWERGLRKTYARLAGAGIPVVAIRGTERPGFDVPACLSRRAARLPLAGACEYDRDESLHGAARAAQASASREVAARGLPVTTIDLADAVCDAPRCGVIQDGLVVFTDDNHLTANFTRAAAPTLGARLDAAAGRLGVRLP